ncbi:ABC-2 type transporter [Rubrobacter radiotolerans]|uniref:Transport permease protein n=1 Tax=Rubrobacter radiotolerans TaxID=42256 RepID=A0A023X5A3_RUBRA|nr:ABC transporter permease [Rubrobacter radiotolerans]AHY47396.1 ABC-2 type transporter [Rubrobacter radiotolerans]MDX5894799.1 ABC transporter permease [Rubrobacter radiotolerans]SMC06785.1 ABC-2 type transport system permease protein [Rubrobacter radiotolerans DSM 5868]
MSRALLTQVSVLARRAVIRTLRQPGMVLPALIFPMVLLAVNAGGLTSATELPGFPTETYLDFAFAFPLVQSAIFGASLAGTEFARDIENGFLNRLTLTPLRPVALLAGLLSGVVALTVLQYTVFLAVGLAIGVDIKSGILGVPVLFLLGVLTSLGFACLGTILALRTGSGEAVQSFFPLFFVLIFFSSVTLPRPLLGGGWFQAVATVNPVSYLVEGLRSLVITGWDPHALALGFGFALAFLAVGLAVAARSMRRRMEA